MTDHTDAADAFLEPRFGESWTGQEEGKKTQVLYQANDYILNSYTFTVDAPEDAPEFKAANYYLAYQLLTTPLSIGTSAPVTSTEERLEGLVTEKTSYGAVTSSDPYPLITKLLFGITAQIGGFMVVGLSK